MTLDLKDAGAGGVYRKSWSVLEAALWIATGDVQTVQGLGAVMASDEWMDWSQDTRAGAAAVAVADHIEAHACRCDRSGSNAAAARAWARLTPDAQLDPCYSWLREDAEDRWCLCLDRVTRLLLSSLREGRVTISEDKATDWQALDPIDLAAGRPVGVTLVSADIRRLWPEGWTNKALRTAILPAEMLDAYLLKHQPNTREAYEAVRSAFPGHNATKVMVESACQRLFPDRRRGRKSNVPAAS
ncbi:hypothetical protein [Sphingomonas sp. Leaf37]|uniref:hypothetical protein n=1 Tax=Sphingomonas sp. Leaf37 TaxID=2876552 RepID=UPI001E63ED19|nr:hypothetical protein [Sphingomonas sp. Leaf37]